MTNKKKGEKKGIAFLTRRYFPTPFCHLSSATHSFFILSRRLFYFFSLCRIFTLVRPECPGGSSLHPKFSLFFSQLLPDSVLLGAGCCVQDLVSFSRPECFDISHSVMARHAHSRGLNDQKGSAQIRAHCRQYTSAFPTAVSSPESATLSVNVKKGKPKNEKKKKIEASHIFVFQEGKKRDGNCLITRREHRKSLTSWLDEKRNVNLRQRQRCNIVISYVSIRPAVSQSPRRSFSFVSRKAYSLVS